ncbi:transcription termination/antitermination factor NusG [Candidatus Daviesbacteria bacterium]|nr:transcription termination/antitermination factor NusG [Candidatus Daviesbacteria bacterium]MBI4038050.1 transcription termination/antitermination factor NusG [Candidatus Daviesbacteria bacterium]
MDDNHQKDQNNPESRNVGDSEKSKNQTSDALVSSDNSDQSGIPSPSESSEKQPASAEDPSLIVQDDKKEIQDDNKKQNPNAKWYVVHTYSGHENKVAHTLKQRVESEHLEEKILEVLVPTQDKIEIKGGKKVNVKEKIFPGYILVRMVLDDISWLAVRTTQGVTGFVGIGNKPTPISEAEVQTIVKFTQTEAPMYKQVFAVSDAVKIVDGPFADFIGKIDSVDGEKGKVRVLVSIFGRETPVELDFLQVQKI